MKSMALNQMETIDGGNKNFCYAMAGFAIAAGIAALPLGGWGLIYAGVIGAGAGCSGY